MTHDNRNVTRNSGKAWLSMMPENLVHPILRAVNANALFPDLYTNKYEHFQVSAAQLVLDMYLNYKPHNQYSDFQSITRDEFRGRFKADRSFISELKSTLLLTHDSYDYKSGFTKGYQLFRAQCNGLNKLFLERVSPGGRLLAQNGREFLSYSSHIGRTPFDGGTEHILEVPTSISVDIDAIQIGIEALAGLLHGQNLPHQFALVEAIRHKERYYTLQFGSHFGREKLNNYLMRVLAELRVIYSICSCHNNTTNSIPQVFKQSSSGRWCGLSFNLQNCTKIARMIALNGMYEFDIESCHHAIALQSAVELGLKTPTLERYVKNKSELRQEFAKTLGVPVEVIKQVLLAMIFGAMLRPGGEINRLLGDNGFKKSKESADFLCLFSELTLVRNAMIEHTKQPNGMLSNCANLAMDSTSNNQRKLAAHLFQGAESCLLSALIAYSNKSILLPIHDAVVSKDFLDVQNLGNYISNTSAIPVAVSGSRYSLIR